MKPKHTQGPWIEDGNGFAKTWDVSNHEGSIATVATNRQDARLIASAPELLETLEAMLEAIVDYEDLARKTDIGLAEAIREDAKRIIEVIKQARGES